MCHYDFTPPSVTATLKTTLLLLQTEEICCELHKSFSQRVISTCIVQLLVRRGIGEESRSNYSILGWLSLIQLAVAFLHQSYKLYQQHNRNTRKTNSQGQSYKEFTSTRFRTDLTSFVMSKVL